MGVGCQPVPAGEVRNEASCLLAAVPGALVATPFAMVLMAAFLTQVGALQTAPILIAVVTAFLTMEGVKYLLASRKQARAAAPAARHHRLPVVAWIAPLVSSARAGCR